MSEQASVASMSSNDTFRAKSELLKAELQKFRRIKAGLSRDTSVSSLLKDSEIVPSTTHSYRTSVSTSQASTNTANERFADVSHAEGLNLMKPQCEDKPSRACTLQSLQTNHESSNYEITIPKSTSPSTKRRILRTILTYS